MPKLLHGGDYNPDQWLDRPDILAKDILLMKEASINSATLGVFAWAALEPQEGNYQLGWLEDIINNLWDNGISTILATPSGAKPNWLAEKYPEARRVNRNGQRELAGERHNHCFTSPVYREKVSAINEKLAERFGTHPAVTLWHISNEYGGECFCDLCKDEFRKWLKNKHKTIENLNKSWWTSFWSHTYNSFEQISPPVPYGEQGLHGLVLDWKRFVTDQTLDFCKHEIEAVRKYSEKPVTTNFMEFFGGLNYFKFKDTIDVVSWDSYPAWHTKNDVTTSMTTSMAHDLMRSIKKQPFLMIESTPSTTNWQPISKLKKPGVHMLSSLMALAHGSDSVMYFQWRKSRGASEKFHGAVVDHFGGSETRVFQDVAAVGKKLLEISDLAGAEINPDIAIIYDWENRWAIETLRGQRNVGANYLDSISDHYRALWEMGIPVDIADCECDFSGYKLVIAPMLYMLRAGIEEKLRDFVKNGGILVGTYMTGQVDENDLCFLGGFPACGLGEVFGLWAEEMDALKDDERNSFLYQGKERFSRDFAELVHPKGAEVLGTYTKDFYAGHPALLKNQFGKGTAYYLATRPEADFCQSFYKDLTAELGIKGFEVEPGVVKSRRGKFVFTLDFNRLSADVKEEEI
ncbi:MAG: beta-galactosidase [Clostridiales bacterium]|nr:beta-galactosidase [Clostridiales bacterium]